MPNSVKITYCTGCKWMLRSAWMAQELLSTFEEELNELTLIPGTGGIFEIHVNGKRIWSRKEQQGFPDIRELKQLVRNEVSGVPGNWPLSSPGDPTKPIICAQALDIGFVVSCCKRRFRPLSWLLYLRKRKGNACFLNATTPPRTDSY